ncbi:PrGVORF78 [Pieris rapae granulovirus Wuhan]|uniref:PrGVORF78 n=1 Tax=Pieris rapae granulovirus Wuhan TaxID=2848030 RepID=D2J4P5_9BBAC|nr:PrGVORF78 [Betabaculovirus arrapae]ACZ63564.1 PrGVORF78 [Betabaculovirus arrapae]UOS85752.1 ORF78 [Pieris rapae granulovirus]
MLVETQTVLKYKQSFALFVYRMLDMTRMAPSPELKQVLKNEVHFLYDLLCLIIYNDNKEESINVLIDWASVVGSDIKLDVFKDMYIEKLTQLNLQEFAPAKFLFSFTTIWDSIHLMCLIADDIIINRHIYEKETVMSCISNFKWIFYNIFIILFCPICAKHYLTVDTFPYEFERVEVALYREKMGEPLQLVEEITRNQIHKNILYKNNLLYKSMIFHNHVNNYRPIQHKQDELNNYQRMDWSLLKTLLGII